MRDQKTNRADRLTHLFAHFVLGDPGVVDSKVFPISIECAGFLISLQTATVWVVFQLEAPIQKSVHVVWRRFTQCIFRVPPLCIGAWLDCFGSAVPEMRTYWSVDHISVSSRQ